MKTVFFGLGTNLGNRESNLENAIRLIDEQIGSVTRTSSVYETPPWGFDAENDFLNMVICVETELSPDEIMKKITAIESGMGRERIQDRYSSRIIDIDILLYDELVSTGNGIKIPHRLMHERRFVLVPMCEIAPDTVHPVLKKDMLSLLKACRDRSKITKL